MLRLCVLASLLVAVGLSAHAQITVRVWDNGTNSTDDQANVYVDGRRLGSTAFGSIGTTWDLGILSAGMHQLTIEHARDADAATLCQEHIGTYGIEFGGGGLIAVLDEASARRGEEVSIPVLANDFYVEADASETDQIPCPTESPLESGDCSCASDHPSYTGEPPYTRTTFETAFVVSGGSTDLEVSRVLASPLDGTAEVASDRKSVAYVPGPSACGTDSFEYEVTAPGGRVSSAVVTVTIENEAPTAIADAFSVAEDGTMNLAAPGVLANDIDPNEDALEALLVDGPDHGTLDLSPGGAVTYEPAAGYNGVDAFTYRTSDGCDVSGTATVAVTVAAVNDPPTAVGDAYELAAAGGLSVVAPGVLENDADPEGDRLTAILAQSAAAGTVTLRPDGGFTYFPRSGFFGVDSFGYRAFDGAQLSDPVVVTIGVRYANTPPIADAGVFYEGRVGAPVRLDAGLSVDLDVGDTLEYRWDFDGDWTYDTDWLAASSVDHVWSEPYSGRVTVEVRDSYRNVLTGDVSEATATVEIRPAQSVRVLVYEDSNGDGAPSGGEPGLAGISVSIGGQTLTTGSDGAVVFELDEGTWTAALTPSSLDLLSSRGYAFASTKTSLLLDAGGEVVVAFAALRTTTKLKGFVYVDVDGDGSFDPGEPLVAGLRVTLDEDAATRAVTDAEGRFFFLRVPFGEHRLVASAASAEGQDKADVRSTEIVVVLVRGAKTDAYAIAWPTASAPAEGFLEVNAKLGAGTP
ncbi:MAG: Ig-like domain-containing protein [Thermotogota bacterium]